MSMTIAQALRQKAESLQKKTDHCFRERLTNTHKRAEEDAAHRREGYTLKATQEIMRKLADMHEAGTCPEPVRTWRHIADVENAVRAVRSAERQKEEYGDRDGKCLARLSEEQKIVRTMMQPPDPKAERLHTLMRDSMRWNIPGYHPTGRAAVEQMVELADFNKPGMTMLEPSAGRGDILDVVREKFGDDVSLSSSTTAAGSRLATERRLDLVHLRRRHHRSARQRDIHQPQTGRGRQPEIRLVAFDPPRQDVDRRSQPPALVTHCQIYQRSPRNLFVILLRAGLHLPRQFAHARLQLLQQRHVLAQPPQRESIDRPQNPERRQLLDVVIPDSPGDRAHALGSIR